MWCIFRFAQAQVCPYLHTGENYEKRNGSKTNSHDMKLLPWKWREVLAHKMQRGLEEIAWSAVRQCKAFWLGLWFLHDSETTCSSNVAERIISLELSEREPIWLPWEKKNAHRRHSNCITPGVFQTDHFGKIIYQFWPMDHTETLFSSH